MLCSHGTRADTANKIAQFFGTSLEPRAKGTGNGKVNKTYQFVTPMKIDRKYVIPRN